MIVSLVAALLGAGLSFVNGANDVSKGVASLVGAGVTDYRRALRLGALATGLGALFGWGFSGAMIAAIGGDLLRLQEGGVPVAAGLAVLVAAGVWVLFATARGLPVSTTHAILGGLVGVGLAARGVEGVAWTAVLGKVGLPLLASPAAGLILAGAAVRLAARRSRDDGPDAGAPESAPADCLCVSLSSAEAPLAAGTGTAAMALRPAQIALSSGSAPGCAREQPRALRLKLGTAHAATAAAVSFARGLNDAPKIVALLLAAGAAGGAPGAGTSGGSAALFLVVAAGMVAGSLAAGRRVTRVMAEDIVPLGRAQGLAANAATAALVAGGALAGLPMSTTHVSTGSIVGAGFHRGKGAIRGDTLRSVALAWLMTLPASAVLGAATLLVLRLLGTTLP